MFNDWNQGYRDGQFRAEVEICPKPQDDKGMDIDERVQGRFPHMVNILGPAVVRSHVTSTSAGIIVP